jgi:membrane-associated protease RseP (regulator of RpoE activity)
VTRALQAQTDVFIFQTRLERLQGGIRNMPFQWLININPNVTKPPNANFSPNPLPKVQPGDNIVWANNDSVPHWPGVTGNPAFFMPNQIAPNSTSSAFSPTAAGNIDYFCSLHPDVKGTIQVITPSADLPSK